MTSNHVLQVNGLSKNYGSQQALINFDLTVKEGEIIGLAGPNGAGKTTLFRIITGLTSSYEGELSLFESSNRKTLNENRKLLGTIIEDPALFPEMTARQNLEFYRRQRGVKDKSRIDELLALVGLADTGKKKFKSFSLGMKQRLAIALSLIHSPKLLIFDEPTNGLDPKGIIEVRELLLKLSQESQLTILVSSHILTELENLANRFVIINHGQKIQEFSKDELYQTVQNYHQVQVDRPEEAKVILQNQLNISDIHIEANGSLKLYGQDFDPADVAKLLVDADFRLSHLARKNYPLEELFIDLTKEGESHD